MKFKITIKILTLKSCIKYWLITGAHKTQSNNYHFTGRRSAHQGCIINCK